VTDVTHPTLGAAPGLAAKKSPFHLDNEVGYRRWRDAKLARYPARIDELIVEVNDPRALTNAERRAIIERCGKANMAIYASNVLEADKDILRLLGRQLGLRRLDCNWLADEDGISQVTVSAVDGRQNYIPYTNRSLNWHTDGYYNPADRRIWAMLLHCVSQALEGGENALMDHEIAYLLMRDENVALVGSLMASDAMTIPARADEAGVVRAEETGQVFHIDPVSGCLHLRYTARTRSIAWRQDAMTQTAVDFLERLLAGNSPYVHRLRLAPGMGIVCNNVLHTRSAFENAPDRQRLLYRSRYLDRLDGN
jgi:alpha-ketoglutarate-dependent taurine dioxygenase